MVVALEQLFSPRTTFCLLNALLIIVTFFTSWVALRSRTFCLTMTLCMAFGTQFHYAYALSAIYAFYLFIAYLEVNLLCVFKLLTLENPSAYWYVGYLSSLVVLLGHETWLNYYLFLVAGGVFLWAMRTCGHPVTERRRIGFVIVPATLLAMLYIPIKVHYGRQHFHPGAEDEVLLGYPYVSLAADDFVSNLITYVYMSFTNYLPPVFLSSNSDYLLPPGVIRHEQYGYH